MLLERDIENKVVRWARGAGVLSRKMNGNGYRGWPDRLFIGTSGATVWVEFKRPGGKLSELQVRLLADLEARGQRIYVLDDAAAAIEILQRALGGQ